MSRRPALVLAVSLLLAGCGSGKPGAVTPDAPRNGAATPVAAVDELVGAIGEGDFAATADLTVPGQAALAALAEGATFGEVAAALRDGDSEVAANFWSGFAQGAGSFLAGPVTADEEGTVDEQGVEFHPIVVAPEEGPERVMMVRDEDGYRIDLFASFGAGLADKMTPVVERLLGAGTEDSRLILSRLQDIVPSLLILARLPSTTPEVSQQLLALVEVITRVG